MKAIFGITFCIWFLVNPAKGQKNFDSLFPLTFTCFDQIDTIQLPVNCIGPNYFNYEEGTIIGFHFSDSSSISILCGSNAILSRDSAYKFKNKTLKNGEFVSVEYYNEITKKYARVDYLKEIVISYEHVSINRKDEFDRMLDLFK